MHQQEQNEKASTVALSNVAAPKFEDSALFRVVAHYAPLARRGSEYIGACPFCEGRFCISSADGFHCGVCDARHNAISLIQAIERIDQTTALKRLRRRVWNPIAPVVEYGRREPAPRRKPARKSIKDRCGARARSTGEPCRAHVYRREDGSLAKRCLLHGGKSCGPKTAEGKARSALNLLLTRTWKRRELNNNKSPERTGNGIVNA